MSVHPQPHLLWAMQIKTRLNGWKCWTSQNRSVTRTGKSIYCFTYLDEWKLDVLCVVADVDDAEQLVFSVEKLNLRLCHLCLCLLGCCFDWAERFRLSSCGSVWALVLYRTLLLLNLLYDCRLLSLSLCLGSWLHWFLVLYWTTPSGPGLVDLRLFLRRLAFSLFFGWHCKRCLFCENKLITN